MKNFRRTQLADHRAEREREKERKLKQLEDLRRQQEELREELRKRREDPKITPKNFFMGQDDWRYD